MPTNYRTHTNDQRRDRERGADRDDSDMLVIRFTDITRTAVQDALKPLTERIEAVEHKVDRFNEDRVTKADLAALRVEIEHLRTAAYPREVADQIRAQINQRIDETVSDIKDIKQGSITAQQRFWIILGGLCGAGALLVSLLQHFSFH